MPKSKRIPVVVSHDSDSSSEGEEEVHSATSSLCSSGQVYTTPSTDLPEIHTSSYSCSSTSSSDYEDMDSLFNAEPAEVRSDIFHSKLNESDDFSCSTRENSLSTTSSSSQIDTLSDSTHSGLSNHMKNERVDHGTTLQHGSQAKKTLSGTPPEDYKNNSSNYSSETINLLVHDDNEDMDISEDESMDTVVAKNVEMDNNHALENSNIGNTSPNQRKEELVHCLKKHGATNDPILSKYSTLKSDRLYCNFNPSLKRGCRIHFPKDSIHELAQHLKLFHGIDSSVHMEPVEKNHNSALDRKETGISKTDVLQTDNKSVSSVEESLYNDHFTMEDPNKIIDTESNYDPESDFIEPFVQVSQLRLSEEPENEEDQKFDSKENKQEQLQQEDQQEDKPKGQQEEQNEKQQEDQQVGQQKEQQVEQQEEQQGNKKEKQKEDQEELMAEKKNKTKAELKRERKKNKPFVSRVTPKLLRSRTASEQPALPPPLPKTRSKSKINELLDKEKRRGRPPKITSDGSKPLRRLMKKAIDNPAKNYASEYKQSQLLKKVSAKTSGTCDCLVQSGKTYVEAGTQVHDTDLEPINTSPSVSAAEPEETPTEPLINNERTSKEVALFKESNTTLQAEAVLPSEEWPLILGFGFFTKNKYHCNANRSLVDSTYCKANFRHVTALIQHLDEYHHYNEEKAMRRREDEENEHISDEIASFIFANNLISDAVEDKSFRKMMASLKGDSDDSLIMPSPQHIRQSLHMKYIKYENRVKRLLRDQRGLAFVTQIWKANVDPVNYILIITALYVDSSWKTNEVIIAFQDLSTTAVTSSAIDSLMKTEFAKVMENFGIKDGCHSVFVANSTSALHKSLNYGFTTKTNNIETISNTIPCLDLILEFAQLQLFNDLEKQLPFLEKINSAYSISKSTSKKLNEASSILLKAFNKDYNESIRFEDIPATIEKFNLACISHPALKKYALNRDDRTKIKNFANLNETLKRSLKWIYQSTARNDPISSKALVTCMEVMDSLMKLAECYGFKSVDSLVNEVEVPGFGALGRSDTVEASLRAVFTTFKNYRASIENRGNPLWRALVLDVHSFAAYHASIRMKQFSYDFASASEISAAFSVQFQSYELEHMMNEEKGQKHVSTALSSSTHMNNVASSNFNKEDSSVSNRKGKRKRSDSDLPNSREENVHDFNHKRKCVKGIVNPSPDFQKYIDEFKKDQYRLLISSGIEYQTGKKIEEYNLLSNEEHIRQIRFWGDVRDNYYPDIALLTRESFPVPITMRECLRATDTIKTYYTALKSLNPSANLAEIQEKALVFNWRKKNGITED